MVANQMIWKHLKFYVTTAGKIKQFWVIVHIIMFGLAK